jgi:nucleotide-binding universal stress UspA family protein
MFDKILVAVDGSDHSLKAAKLAGNLALSPTCRRPLPSERKKQKRY